MTKQEIKTFQDLQKFTTYVAGFIFSLLMFFSYCTLQLVLEQIVSLSAAILLLVLSVLQVKILTINKTGIRVWQLIGKNKEIQWDTIKEIGVIGTKVFPKTEKNKGGRKYIYFSGEKLTEDERFDMALKWPPKIPYTSFKKEKLELITQISGI